MKTKNRISTIVLSALLLVVLVFVFVLFAKPDFPSESVRLSVEAIGRARSANAQVYAHREFLQAQNYYNKSLDAFRTENNKLPYQRNYQLALSYSGNALKMARQALEKTEVRIKTLRNDFSLGLKQVKARRDSVLVPVNYLELNSVFSQSLNQINVLLFRSEESYKREELNEAITLLQEVDNLIDQLKTELDETVKSSFGNSGQWEAIVAKAIRESKENGSAVIIVDKLARLCRLYKSGTLTNEFDAEFGSNWIGDKQHQGDHRTPEGIYRIKKKKERSLTKYYKALEINYPNESDEEHFQQLIEDNVIESGSKIGGLIEIHGAGGRGFNWTEGCVALTNENIDILYKNVSAGTPVIIVGSLNHSTELIKKLTAEIP
jgi:hypothetical protein